MAEGYGHDVVTILKPLNQLCLCVKMGQFILAGNPCRGHSRNEILVQWFYHLIANTNDVEFQKNMLNPLFGNREN